jgi:hypothetical protein
LRLEQWEEGLQFRRGIGEDLLRQLARVETEDERVLARPGRGERLGHDPRGRDRLALLEFLQERLVKDCELGFGSQVHHHLVAKLEHIPLDRLALGTQSAHDGVFVVGLLGRDLKDEELLVSRPLGDSWEVEGDGVHLLRTEPGLFL